MSQICSLPKSRENATHAEENIEVTEIYFKTVMIASQRRSLLPQIPLDEIGELLAIMERLGMPDPRLPRQHPRKKKRPAAAGHDSGSRPLSVPAEMGPRLQL